MHAVVTRMVLRKQLSVNAGVFLNAALGNHAFTMLHHCTHESISQHNPEHMALENTVYRLACRVISFDDSYKVAHRAHHFCANHADDPDLLMSYTSLPVLGNALYLKSLGQMYVGIGSPINIWVSGFLYWTGLSDLLLSNVDVINKAPFIKWDCNLLKMATFESLNALETMDGAKDLHCTVSKTWSGASYISLMLAALFIARYPHRNGRETNVVASYYDCTYSGQGEGAAPLLRSPLPQPPKISCPCANFFVSFWRQWIYG